MLPAHSIVLILVCEQIKLDESTVITGSEDGFARGVSIYPNEIVEVLGQHEDDQQFPISRLSMSHCQNFLASCSHDNSIKFYDISKFVKKRKQANVINSDQDIESYHQQQN